MRTRGHSSPRANRVSLEPPYRPLLGKHRIKSSIIDDARKPGLVEKYRAHQPKESLKELPSSYSQPVSHERSGELAELQLLTRPGQTISTAIASALLGSFTGVSRHVGFELIGLPDKIVPQFVCDTADRSAVCGSLRAFSPEAQISECPGFLRSEWENDERFGAILTFGLQDRVFRMLRSETRLEPDPLTEIIGRLDDLTDGELALFQILFSPARFPWRKDLDEFLSNIEDVDKAIPLVRAKFAEPTFAAVIRVAAVANSSDVAASRVSALASALFATTRSAQNELVLVDSTTRPFNTEQEDLLDRQSHHHGMLLSLSELLTLVHPPSGVRSERLIRQSTRTKAAPAIVAGKGLVLGVNNHNDVKRPVALAAPQRLKHVHVVGSTGRGKSSLLLSMAIQDIDQGNGFAVLDPHGDLVEDILAHIPESRTRDVILFDPADDEFPIGFNVLSAHSELERTLLSSDFVAIFRRLSSTTFGDQMVSVLGNAVLAILESSRGGTLLDLRRFLTDKGFRSRFLESVEDDEVVYYWRNEFPLLKGVPHAPLLTRLNTFLRPKVLRYMVAQRRDRLDIRSIMDNRKILLAKLSHGLIGEENSHLLGSLLVAKIAQATASRQDEEAGKRVPFTLYIDEFHHFVTPSVAGILSGARKHALSVVMAHHSMRQIQSRSADVASALLANAYTRIVFQVGEQDARTLAEGFSFFEAADLQSLGVGHALARVERADFDFNLQTLLPATIPADVRGQRRSAVREASREGYATPRAEVEGILATMSESKHDAEASRPEKRPAARRDPSHRAAPIASIAEGKGLPGRGGVQHKYLQSLIKRLAEDRGFTVVVEKTVLDGHGHIDVALSRNGLSVACEISVTTRVAHELGNLTKCLAAGFRYAVLVSSDARTLELARLEMTDADRERIHLLTVDGFIEFLDELDGGRISARSAAIRRDRDEKVSGVRADSETTDDGKRMLNTRDAAAYVGLAVQTLAKLRVTGGSPPFYKLGRQVLYDRAELDNWISARRRRSTSDGGS